MTRLPATIPSTTLSQQEGMGLLSAPETLLKGALECELELSMIAGSRHGAFAAVFELATSPAAVVLLRQHAMRAIPTPDARRAVSLASQSARSGRAALVLVPNDELDESIADLAACSKIVLDRGGALGFVFEDDPQKNQASCPRQAAIRLGLPIIEPGDVPQMRDGVEQILRLSRAARAPVGMVVHGSILRSMDTLEARPNRAASSAEVLIARRRRRARTSRWAESGGVLRLARRMELNAFRAIPNPGERVPVGFVTVGPATGAIGHLANALGLYSRVPVLQLGLINPIDESALERLLTRCQQVIVLEPRPGVIESSVLAVAESLRRAGGEPAVVWGRLIPPDVSGARLEMDSDADLHPSVLVRKISHLLHQLRPALEVSEQLVPDIHVPSAKLPARSSLMGANAAQGVLRRMVADVDQWLRERAPLEERGIPASSLAIDGQEPPGSAARVVVVELWDHRRFVREGLSALVQAATEDRPWMFIVCEEAGSDIRDLERLARGAVPGERADRVSLEIANLSDRPALRETLREAALVNKLTVVIVRDGPPAEYDVTTIERSLAEIDRLGFEPTQKLVRAAEQVCDIRSTREPDVTDLQKDIDPALMKSSIQAENLAGESLPVRMRVRPLLEEVEVIRVKPPLAAWRADAVSRPTAPQIVHARQASWRAHLAGFRDEPPGAGARILCDAGRSMGYHVRSVDDPTPIGPGRRAWAQVLFTHPREGESQAPMSTVIPFGEADLLLGLDASETLRAIEPTMQIRVAFPARTHAVVNADSQTEPGGDAALVNSQLDGALHSATNESLRLVRDFAGACRQWFHTDRLADVAMIGAAFQLGLIPVTVEAIETAVNAAESRGLGRSKDAFEFGRRLAVGPHLFARVRDDREEEVHHLTRRIVLSLNRGGWGGGARARRFSRLLSSSLDRMPGLSETEPGRLARRDFVLAMYRCLLWGGFEQASLYGQLITQLYEADRGDRGRALCRLAVLPLAEAMLIRDPIYIASMATSAEQRRRTRRQLNVKEARGDRIERRYLTRLEFQGFGRRIRADVRTSDWPGRALRLTRRMIPLQWRGTARERELRQYVIEFIRRAIDGASADYDTWVEAVGRLHGQAAENRLRDMALAELRMLAEPSMVTQTAARPMTEPASTVS